MSDTGKQSPLGVNVVNSLLITEGLYINPKLLSWAGIRYTFPDYTFGKICQDTVLRVLTWTIQKGFNGNPDGKPNSDTYNNLISIGAGAKSIPITQLVSGSVPSTNQYYFEVKYSINQTITVGQYVRITGATPDGYNGNWLVSEVINSTTFRVYTTASYGAATTNGYLYVDSQVPALGNAKPLVYTWEYLNGPFGAGQFYLNDTQGWGGSTYKYGNPATQWGYISLLSLQAWMEFNYNDTLNQGSVDNPKGYRDFLQSFQNAYGFISYSNSAILAVDNSKDFLDGTYSSMNDLITADITNVSLALKSWGQDLVALGKALDLSQIDSFGMPSTLLKTLAKYNGLTKNLSLAIIAAGIPANQLGEILGNIVQPTIEQERKLYASFVLTVGESLTEVLISINCKTQGLSSLADLLNPKKLFPNSYSSLTVPLYADSNTPATQTTTTPVSNLSNSKVFYLLYDGAGGVNSQLTSTTVIDKIGVQLPPGNPLISTSTIGESVVIQTPAKGFGSYLSTILPPSIATTAGAFSVAMKQIKNIKEVPIEKFAQVVTNLETMAVTNANGTQNPLNTNQGTQNNVPTNLNLRKSGRPLIALGSGPQGTYTASDFFGCMSGLPYNGTSGNPALGIPESGLEGIYNKLKQLATTKLYNIYRENYLAVTWERARATIVQNVFYENVQSYVPAVIDTDPNSPKYNQVIVPAVPRIDNWYYTVSFSLTVKGGGYGRGSAPPPKVILFPNNCNASFTLGMGTSDLDIPYFFGTVYELSKNYGEKYLYTSTEVLDAELPTKPTPPEEFITIEAPPTDPLSITDYGSINPNGQNNPKGWTRGSQGTEDPGYNAWASSNNSVIQGYIGQANGEITNIRNSNPTDCVKLNNYWNTTGYQLTIEQRARMMGLKPALSTPRDNNLSLWPTVMYTFTDSIPSYGKNAEPHMYAQTLENISNWDTVGGQSIVAMMRQERNQARLSAIGVDLDNNIPDKLSYEQQKILIVNGSLPTGSPNPNIPSGSITAPPTDPFVETPTVPSSPIVIRERQPVIPDPYSTEIDTGGAMVPGSFAGSPYYNLIPPNLNAWYTSATLMPSTYSVNSAIEEVIRCNCDCWTLA